jgi:hypothetical protein
MTSKLRVKYKMSNAATGRLRMVNRGQTVQEVISFIGQIEGLDINKLSLDGFRLAPDDLFDDFYESKDQLFVFSTSESPSPPKPTSPVPPPERPHSGSTLPDPPSPASDRPVSEYVRDFCGLREVRVVGTGATGVVKLYEDPSTHELIAVRIFDSKATQGSDGSSGFFREIDALVLLVHPCVLRIVGYCLATRTGPAQIGTEFAAGGVAAGGAADA